MFLVSTPKAETAKYVEACAITENSLLTTRHSQFPETAIVQLAALDARSLVFFFGIALLADFAVFFGFDAALVFAVFASGFGLVAAGFSVEEANAAQHDEGGEDCSNGLHLFDLSWPAHLAGTRFVYKSHELSKRLSFNIVEFNCRETIAGHRN